jgi:hypothetical protein
MVLKVKSWSSVSYATIMKRKFKQWWSSIPPISTKRTFTFHLNSLNTKKTMTYDVGNPCPGLIRKCDGVKPVSGIIVRDSSAVRRLCVRLAGAVGRQSALHKENSGFAAPTLGWHISTFCGYRILFSIRNPYINRFTNHFSIHS